MESRWSLLRDDAGQPKAVLAINTDITEKKRLEAQYLRAQRMESIGMLAGGIAHDLNNVLAPIVMAIQLLRMRHPETGDQKLLNTIEASAQRGADLVRQVLTFARGLEGQHLLVQPKTLVRDVEKLIKETFGKSIEVMSRIDADLWPVPGDPTQLHQVLMNLCVNARDAMPHGGQLTLTARNARVDEQYAAMTPDLRPGLYVVFEVQDTGTGMTPEAQRHVFEPFFTTKAPGKGTGLGLSTALTIVRNHDGVLSFSSVADRGTTFKIHLPASAETAVARGATTGPAAAPRQRRNHPGRRRRGVHPQHQPPGAGGVRLRSAHGLQRGRGAGPLRPAARPDRGGADRHGDAGARRRGADLRAAEDRSRGEGHRGERLEIKRPLDGTLRPRRHPVPRQALHRGNDARGHPRRDHGRRSGPGPPGVPAPAPPA